MPAEKEEDDDDHHEDFFETSGRLLVLFFQDKKVDMFELYTTTKHRQFGCIVHRLIHGIFMYLLLKTYS